MSVAVWLSAEVITFQRKFDVFKCIYDDGLSYVRTVLTSFLELHIHLELPFLLANVNVLRYVCYML